MPQPEPVTLVIGNKKISVGLYKISVTGGVVLHPAGVVLPSGFATIAIKTAWGLVSGPVEFLRTPVPGKRNAVAFRFFNMDPVHHGRLEQAVEQMCRKGFGDKQNETWFQSVLRSITR